MKMRMIAILVLLCMLILLMIGCSSIESSATIDHLPSGSESAKTGPQVTAPGQLPVTSEPVKLTIAIIQNVRVSDYENNYMTKMIKDECGIDLDFVLLPTDQPAQKFQLMASVNDKLPDIVHFSFSDAERASYGAAGTFIPLNDYMDRLTYWYKMADMDEKEYNQIKALGTSADGNFYGFPAYMNSVGDLVQYTMNINHNWLDKLDLKMPKSTTDFYNVLISFRDEDPNGNGKKDEIPFLNYSYYKLRGNLEPEETAKRLLFTTDEDASINEIRTTINGYINESIALFATGAMDIEAGWDTYVRQLKDMGLDEYMQTSQAAYDRMYK